MPRPNHIFQKLLLDLRQQVTKSFAPKEVLPSQRAWAEMYGVGQATVHRVLRQLAREGLVRARPGSAWVRVGKFGPGAPGALLPARPRGKRQRALRVGLLTRRTEREWTRKASRSIYAALMKEARRAGAELVLVPNLRPHHPTPARNRIELRRVPWNDFDVALLVEVEDAVTLSDPLLRTHRVLAVDQDARVYGLSSVSFDDVEAGRLAARHLFELGHRRFAVTDEINDPGWPAEPTWLARRQGFEAAVGRLGAMLRPEWHLPCARHGRTSLHASPADAARRTARTWAEKPRAERPTALFAIDPTPLEPLLDELARHGLGVPRDLSVVIATWDKPDDPPARSTAASRADSGKAVRETPRYTTLYLDLPALARRVFETAAALAATSPPPQANPSRPAELITIPALLRPGASTAPPEA